MRNSRNDIFAATIICLALIARLGMLLTKHELLTTDPDAYVEIAQHLSSGHGFSRGISPQLTAYRPPLYPLLLAAIFELGGNLQAIGLIQVALGTLTVGLTLALGRRLNLQSGACLAAFFVALDPILLQYTVLPMTETLCTLLVTLWLWSAIESSLNGIDQEITGVSLPQSRRRDGLSGLLLGLCCLCRPTFLPLAGLTLFGHDGQSSSSGVVRFLLRLQPTFWLGLILILAPWIVRNGFVVGKFTPATTHGGYTLLLANNPVFYHEVVLGPWGTVWEGRSLNAWQAELEQEMSAQRPPVQGEVARDRWMYHAAWKNIQAEPLLFLRACGWRVLRFWDIAPHGPEAGRTSRLIGWCIAAWYGLILVGMFTGCWSLCAGEWRNWLPLIGLLCLLTAIHSLYWTDMRMRAPAIPAIALLAARGWMQILAAVCPRKPGPIVSGKLLS